MSIFWTDSDRNVSKSFFHPHSKMDAIHREIYHLLHCNGHYNGKVVDGKLHLTCSNCLFETTEISPLIVRSVTFAPIDNSSVVNES